MFVTTRVDFDWQTGRVISRRGYIYFGPVALLKGATAAETNLQQQQSQFYKTVSDNYATTFANNQAILSSLQTSLTPVLSQGINGFGYNPAEVSALNAQAVQGTGTAYANAAKTLGENLTSQSGGLTRGPGGAAGVAAGGGTYIPSGAAGQLEETLASQGAQTESNALLGIQQQGYEAGRQNYLSAANLLGGVAGQYNPASYGSLTNNAGSSAFSMADAIQKQNAAASPWGAVGGILGGVAGSFLGPIGASVGSSIGGAIGGAGSGSSAPDFSGFTYDPGSPSASGGGAPGIFG